MKISSLSDSTATIYSMEKAGATIILAEFWSFKPAHKYWLSAK
ncbi:MAG: hypothetical protein V4683_14750 [Bacteroidota bacterium]